MTALQVCHACPHRQRPCSGPCACLIDGVDIIDHAERGECPKGLYASVAATAAVPVPRPRLRGVEQPPPQPAPKPWPILFRAIAALRVSGEIGIGDTVKRLTGEAGKKYQRLMKRLKKDCGCSERHDRWNIEYKYD